MPRIHRCFARFSLGSALLLASALFLGGSAESGTVSTGPVESETGSLGLVAAPGAALEWSWRALGEAGWGRWNPLGGGPVLARPAPSPHELLVELGIQPPDGALAVEMLGRRLDEEGEARRLVLWTPSPAASLAGPPMESLAASEPPRHSAGQDTEGKRAIASVQGRLLYLDRIFDLSGYTGAARRLPLRRLTLQLVRSRDDSLMVSGSTAQDGSFLLEYDALTTDDLRLRLLSQVEGHPGLAPRVLDSAGPGGDLTNSVPLIHEVLEIIGMGPGTSLNIGEMELSSSMAGDPLSVFNLVDQLLDVSEMLASPDWLFAAPDSLPPLIWSPSETQFETRYEDGVVRVASPAGGDTDAWADAVVLAALGEWYLERYSRVDVVMGNSDFDLAVDPRRAYQKGAAIVFAALVRQYRATNRVDADGLPVDADVSAHVDLGFAPPLGFPGLPQDGFDLESRELAFGGQVLPRGQSSIANVAAMLWDLVDDEDTPDGIWGDDDLLNAVDSGPGRFHLHASTSLPALAPDEAISYEDFHLAWADAHGEAAALDSIAVAVGRTALFSDAFEDDDDPLLVIPILPWTQPAPAIDGGIVISELHLGDRDWVELSNTGMLPVLLEGWRLVTRRNGFSEGPEREMLIPDGVALAPGRSLVIFEGGEAIHDDALALHDPTWQVPWREGADGACILYQDGGVAVDFVRWDAVGEASGEPLPWGQGFSGNLLSPSFAATLSRDSLATDSDSASDFNAALPSPYAPNGDFLVLRSLHPSSDLDHLALSLLADEEVFVLAATEREAPRPSIRLLDLAGNPELSEGPRAGDPGSALFAWSVGVDEDRILRLIQDADPPIATALRYGAWIPWDSGTLLPPIDFAATSRHEDPALDTVDLSWTNTSIYDSVRLYVDGVASASLPGFSESYSLMLGAGHHGLELEPVQGGVVAERSTSRVFVGTTPRFFATGFEIGDSVIFDYLGFAEVEEASVGGWALLDHANPASTYPPDDVALAELRDPVDLTSSSVLRFRHAAHLAQDGDRAFVELSLDDGASWESVAEFTGGDHVGGGDPADWTDFDLTPGDWVEEELDLSPHAGTRVLVRFRRVSNGSGEGPGWMLDDVFFGSPPDGTVWVSPDGDDLFGCGHPERPFAGAATAFEQTAYGDTLRLEPGTYAETVPLSLDGSPRPVNLTPPPGVSIRGAGIGQSFVEIKALGTGVYFGPLTAWADTDSAVVEGLSFRRGSRGVRVDLGRVEARKLHLDAIGTGILVEGGELRAERLLITRNGRAARQAGGRFFLSRATITELERAIFIQSEAESTRVENSIFTRITRTAIERQVLGPAPVLACNDFYGFSGSSEVFLGIPDPIGVDGNLAVPVEFCDFISGDYTLAQGSILLDLPGCGPVGAFDEGCLNTAVDAPPARVGTRLLGNHPNPFNPRTRIRFVLARPGPVRLRLYDSRGRMVRELLAQELAAGEHRIDWDATDAQGRRVASGIYHLELRANGERHTRAMALLK